MGIEIDPRVVAVARKAARECICSSLRRATRAVTRLYDEALKPTGLKITQFNLLSSLMAMGSSTLSDLAADMQVDRTTLTRNLEILEGQGLVATAEGLDRRERQLTLSEKGLAALKAAYPLWQAAQTRAVEWAGRTNWNAAAPTLRRLAAASEDGGPSDID